MILEGEVKDAKMSSFSSDFQTLIKHYYNFLCIFYGLFMSLKSKGDTWSRATSIYVCRLP